MFCAHVISHSLTNCAFCAATDDDDDEDEELQDVVSALSVFAQRSKSSVSSDSARRAALSASLERNTLLCARRSFAVSIVANPSSPIVAVGRRLLDKDNQQFIHILKKTQGCVTGCFRTIGSRSSVRFVTAQSSSGKWTHDRLTPVSSRSRGPSGSSALPKTSLRQRGSALVVLRTSVPCHATWYHL